MSDLAERVKTESYPMLWNTYSLKQVIEEKAKLIELKETEEERLFRNGMNVSEEQIKLDIALRQAILDSNEWMKKNCPAWDNVPPSLYRNKNLKSDFNNGEVSLCRDSYLAKIGMHERLKPLVAFVEKTIASGEIIYIRIEDGLSFQSESIFGLVWNIWKWKLKKKFPRVSNWLTRRKETKNAEKK